MRNLSWWLHVNFVVMKFCWANNLLLVLFLFSIQASLFGQEKVRIGLFANKELQEIQFVIDQGGALLQSEDCSFILPAGTSIVVQNNNGNVSAHADTLHCNGKKITLQSTNLETIFQIQFSLNGNFKPWHKVIRAHHL